MEVPDVATPWKSKINEVTIVAGKDEGGTRGKIVTIGGQSASSPSCHFSSTSVVGKKCFSSSSVTSLASDGTPHMP